jgi:hypothetical protein
MTIPPAFLARFDQLVAGLPAHWEDDHLLGWMGNCVLVDGQVVRTGLREHMRHSAARTFMCEVLHWDPWLVGRHDWDRLRGEPHGLALSTVFLGYDGNLGRGEPECFELMVFVDGEGGERARFATYADALTAHEYIAAILTDRYGPADRWIVNDGRAHRLLPAPRDADDVTF